MDYLQQLLNNQPVEWKKLGEVCDFQNGFAFKSSLFKEKGLPIIRITNISGGRVTDEDYKYFDPSDYPKRVEEFRVSQGDILIAMSGATTGKIGWYDNEVPAYLNQRVGRFMPNSDVLNNRFLYHYLQMKGEHLYLMAGGGAQPNLSSTDIKEKLPIPIPPLSVQSRIVEILDKFTALEAELEEQLQAELELRKKQYAYYCEQLLNFSYTPPSEFNVVYKKLGEIADYIRGVTYNKQAETQEEDSWVVLRANNIDINSRQLCFDNLKRVVRSTKVTPKQHLQIGDILICAGSGSKEHIGKTAYIAERLEYTFGGFMGVVRCDSSVILPRFLFHYIGSNSFKRYLAMSLKSSTINNLNSSIMNSFPIPIPPLSEQQRIVEILDKFDTLTNSISEGLPLEIQLRRQQYEYYREQLLAFPHP